MEKNGSLRKRLAIPYVIFLILFVVLPLFVILYYAFTDAAGNVSFANFLRFFQNGFSIIGIGVSDKDYFFSVQHMGGFISVFGCFGGSLRFGGYGFGIGLCFDGRGFVGNGAGGALGWVGGDFLCRFAGATHKQACTQ